MNIDERNQHGRKIGRSKELSPSANDPETFVLTGSILNAGN